MRGRYRLIVEKFMQKVKARPPRKQKVKVIINPEDKTVGGNNL